jgi:hypothetical protein
MLVLLHQQPLHARLQRQCGDLAVEFDFLDGAGELVVLDALHGRSHRGRPLGRRLELIVRPVELANARMREKAHLAIRALNRAVAIDLGGLGLQG